MERELQKVQKSKRLKLEKQKSETAKDNEAVTLEDNEEDENNFDNEATKRNSTVKKISQNRRSDKIKDIGSTSHKIKQKIKKSSSYSTNDDNDIDDAVHSDNRSSVSSDHMYDIEFKSTLSTSVKRQEDSDHDRKRDRIETENIPSLRHVAEDNDDSPESAKSNPTPLGTKKENFPPLYNISLSWNNEMRVLYNDSCQAEPFILSELLQKMNPDRDLWNICLENRCNISSNKRRYNPKCTNCNQFGHKPSQCKRQRKPMTCYMCGESGHHVQQCPNTICLRCGKKTHVFTKSCNSCNHQSNLTCSTCKVRGHSSDYCPDMWRRYHSTTEQHINPNKTLNNNPRKYCCNCGGRGHLSDYCRKVGSFMEYTPY